MDHCTRRYRQRARFDEEHAVSSASRIGGPVHASRILGLVHGFLKLLVLQVLEEVPARPGHIHVNLPFLAAAKEADRNVFQAGQSSAFAGESTIVTSLLSVELQNEVTTQEDLLLSE